MRAKSRAMAVSIGAALVVVPLSGAAAVAISGSDAPTPDAKAVAVQGTKYVSEVAQIGAPVAAKVDSVFQLETPALTVTVNPVPVVVVHRAAVPVRTVANSASVSQAIAGSAIIAEASKYVGIAYRSGGTSPSTGFDCSGFVSYVYAQFGISLPHNSGAYYGVGTRVDSPQPGDIILTPGHVGLYAGPNLQIDSPRPGKVIEFRAIWQVNPVYIRVTG
jgi:cell wall-associated NlpC family hydrolase